ncbi:MAG: type II toxin-antitoxin system death-on-curing family toxin [Tepidisphaerales bacterium]
MSKEPKWLSTSAVLAIQQRLLSEFGGAEGVRDQGLLESALSRPQHLWHYERPDIPDLAAAYAFGIINNHPFVDGNKRTAFTATFVFLSMNGYELEADEGEVVLMTVGLAEKSIRQEQYAAWLRDHCSRGHQ